MAEEEEEQSIKSGVDVLAHVAPRSSAPRSPLHLLPLHLLLLHLLPLHLLPLAPPRSLRYSLRYFDRISFIPR